MSEYRTSGTTFDIKETFNGQWAVIQVPDLSSVNVGTGKHLGTFESEKEAQQYCNHWNT